MKLSRNQVTVAGNTVTASVMTGGDPYKVILHASRYFPNLPNEHGGKGKFLSSWANGMEFKTSEAAWQFALEHGYSQAFTQSWCPHCRTLHRGHAYIMHTKRNGRLADFTITPRRGYIPLFDGMYWTRECKKSIAQQLVAA